MTTTTNATDHHHHADASLAGAVVVGVDGSEDADRAVAWAADQATLENRALVLVHGSPMSGHGIYPGAEYMIMDDSAMKAQDDYATSLLSQAEARARTAHPELRISVLDIRSDSREALVQAARYAHLVVVGSRGRARAASMLLGSVSASVASRSDCPVVVVRPASSRTRTPGVVVGARLSPDAVPVVEYAFTQASLRGVPLRVVHFYLDTESTRDALAGTWSPGLRQAELREELSQAVAGLSEKYPDVEVHLDLTSGSFRTLLADEASEHDLVVIGRRCGGHLDRTIGTWSTISIVEHAAGTVVVVPEARA